METARTNASALRHGKKRDEIVSLLKEGEEGKKVRVMGWIRTRRGSKNVHFFNLNDGSTILDIQVVASTEEHEEETPRQATIGAAISVDGTLVASKGSEQSVEVHASALTILGGSDPDAYPIQPKKHSLEFLRENAHLRARTRTFGAVFRIRHGLAYAIHKFFHENGYYYLHTPIITASDAEGAGEMFSITSHDLNALPRDKEGNVDHSRELFGRPTNLTVSGQLEAELGALGLGKVYTFGPTFRAENSNTWRHAAEFWMVEPEIAFADIHENMDIAEALLHFVLRFILEHYPDDLEFLKNRELEEEQKKKKEQRRTHDLKERIERVAKADFERITYTEAVSILQDSKPYKKGKFEYEVAWGKDLQSEHERHLVEKEFKKPVIIRDYPKDFKAFYMRVNDDDRTVGALDVLFPGIGEIIGGSQREERYNVLKDRIREMGVDEKVLWWYMDTRRFGSAPHSGFGLGFERLVMFATGMHNIRDVLPFPRTPMNAEF